MTNAAVYVRISKDRDGTSESPERQEAIARSLAESKGWEVVEVFSDLDLSAYKKGVVRPGYDAMLAAVREGRIGAVAVWSVTRLARTVKEFSWLLSELEGAGVMLASARDPIDTSTPTGRAMTQIHGVFAELESATIASRVKDAQAHARSAGQMWRGGSRAFGWRDGKADPIEGPIVQEIAARLLAGEARERVARDLNERGITPSGGGKWWSSSLRKMICAPIHAGYRLYDGEVFEGSWEPLISRADHHRLLGIRAVTYARKNAPLLSGVLKCGHCFCTMYRAKSGGRMWMYRCQKSQGRGNCGRLSINADKTEVYLTDAVLGFIAEARLQPLMNPLATDETVDDLLAAIAEDEQALADLAQDRYVRRTITAVEFEAVRTPLDERLTELRRALAAAAPEPDVSGLLPPGDRAALDEWWKGASLDEQRLVLNRSLVRVLVLPRPDARHGWHPEERILHVFDPSVLAETAL